MLKPLKIRTAPLRNPDAQESANIGRNYLDTLRAQGLFATVKAIEPFDQFT
jgi:hypothetical protein